MNISFLNSLLKFQPKNSTLVEEKETITLDDSDENISRMQKEDFERCNSIEIIHDLMDEEEAVKDAIENRLLNFLQIFEQLSELVHAC